MDSYRTGKGTFTGDPLICRFYGGGAGGNCEMGTAHLSPSDVETVARYCSSDYRSCPRHGMLAQRMPTFSSTSASPESAPEVEDFPRPLGAIPPERTREFQKAASTPADPGKSPSQPKRSRNMVKKGINPGWTVVLAGTGINLALGILYAWSIFKGEIAASVKAGGDFSWDPASINDPYALCCLVFAFAMIAAGKCQDRIGPSVTALIGGLLVGGGFIMISSSNDYWAWLLGFGVLAGTGIGFGYSAATPPAIKWFPPAKTGMVTGIVVSGFGLASVYIAPLSKYLVGSMGLSTTMFIYGVGFAVIVSSFSILLINPPRPALAVATGHEPREAVAVVKSTDAGPRTVLRSYRFYALWIAFFVGSGAGLMVIGSVAGMAKASLGESAFIAVALMAIGNAAGRIVAGTLSDRIGRVNTLLMVLLTQATLMFASIFVVGVKETGPLLLVVLAAFIGFNYGANLSLFPSLAKDYWGLKNFGINYGLLFTAWGVGGFVMGRVSQMLESSTGSFTSSFIAAGTMLLIGSAMAFTLKLSKSGSAAKTLLEETPAKVA